MAKFRKKPVVIEAFQWWPQEPVTWPGWATDREITNGEETLFDGSLQHVLYIKTLEGTHMARPGDWIVRGIKGELYPCKADIFAATYEPVED